MSTPEELLKGMEQILSELLANARKMVALSQQDFSATDMRSLQALQEQLVSKLVDLDTTLNQQHPSFVTSETPDPATVNIQAGLVEFETLNNVFIENLRSHRTILQFETEKAPKSRHGVDSTHDPHKPSTDPSSRNPAIDPKNDHQ